MRLFSSDLRVAAVAVLALATSVGAQQDDPVNDFCRRWGHESAVIGDRLYIDGGQLNFQDNPKNFTNTRLLFHDLTTTKRNDEEVGLPILETNLTKQAEFPSLSGGILWADQANARLYQFGGQWAESETPEARFRLYSYDVYGNQWSARDPDKSISRLAYGAGTSVEHLGRAFYMGGWMNEKTDRNWVGPRAASNKLLMYDMIGDKWTNSTGPSDQEGRAEGVLFYVPFSDNGMLAYFGGVRVNSRGVERAGSMSTIDIFDLAGNKWYTQNATGDIPEPRHRFCGGIATAEDGSSSNIYIYGGLGFGANATGFDDAYILSLPTFTWIKIYPAKGIVREEKDAYPKFDMSCAVVKGSQLVIIGGQYSKDLEVTSCDVPKAWGVHNLVMSKVDTGKTAAYWGSFDPKRDKYTIPDDIIDVIGGDAYGNAQVKSPDPKFDSADLDVLFRRTVTVKPRVPTRTAPAVTASSGASTEEAGVFSTPGKRAAILVPVICGIAILAILGFFAIRWYRRKKRSQGFQQPHDAPPPQYKQDSNDGLADVHATQHPQERWENLPQLDATSPGHQTYPDAFHTGPYSDYSGTIHTPRHTSPPPVELGGSVYGTLSRKPVPAGSPPGTPITPVVTGHFPPPLLEGLMQARNPPPGPEMKDRGGNRFSENL